MRLRQYVIATYGELQLFTTGCQLYVGQWGRKKKNGNVQLMILCCFFRVAFLNADKGKTQQGESCVLYTSDQSFTENENYIYSTTE